MQIGELAEATGTSTRSLRYYEDQGLISSRRRANGYREYDAVVVEEVGRIRLLLDSGFGVATIRKVLPCMTGTSIDMCAAVEKEIRETVAGIEAQLGELTRRRDRVTELLAGTERVTAE